MFGVFLSFVASHIVYLALHLEASSFPKPLTPTQEIEAFAAFKAGDLAARDRIIRHNLRLVAHIVKKYYSTPGDAEDLISIGTIGLIKAVNSFDNTKKARFSTYASKCIDNEVRMSFRKLKKAPATMSMQDPIEAGKDGSTLTVIDVVPDDFIIHEDYEQREESARLHDFVEHLSGRERQVILLRYGLSGQPPLTQQEVADLLGISRSYISRIEKAAVEKLRTGMTSQDAV
ncbi:sigma-70 family RNA polymerase sigma factor [Allofournierella sp.]|uniref:sigma-70 family RNA polymerase sigma factor n=1 Tax=Allofournierella sp. TaxID=1940256 RepID=UPI003AB87E26